MSAQLKPGQAGTYGGLPCVLVRHYAGAMWEMRMPGGLVCQDIAYFIPA